MHTETESRRLARRFLESSVRQLEQDAERAGYNTLCIRDLAQVAKLLGEEPVVARALPLLHAGTALEGWPPDILERMRYIPTLNELEAYHPPYRAEQLRGRVEACAREEAHFAFCLQNRYDEAVVKFRSGHELQEVAATAALFGHFATAFRLVQDYVPVNRRQDVMLVIVIELFRRGHVDDAMTVLQKLEQTGLDSWQCVHLAIGFAGREPWCGYPYPDF